MTKTLQAIFERDLNKLTSEIEAYSNEEVIWSKSENVSNSAGNLCLHLIGNLNWFIGNQIGGTGYVRERELEFSSKNVVKALLISDIEKTKSVVKNALDKIPDEQLEQEYPLVVFKEKMTTYYFLIHLTTHLAYHLGQINYHRRLLDV